MTRIAPAMPPFAPEVQRALDNIMRGAPPLVLFTTLARNPRVFQRFMAGGLLDPGSISLREREIVIDRTTARCGSEYEWGVHVAIFARAAGLSDAQIDATVKGGDKDAVWSPHEAMLVRLVDTLHDTGTVDDALWRALKAEFSDEQLIECIVLTGFYHTVSFVTNALRIPPEENTPRFPA
jgi:alkylhydroperoxidase family enzyme